MVLISCVVPSNLTVLARFLFPPEQGSLSLCVFCAERFSVYSLSNLYSSEDYLGLCNRHIFFAPVSALLRCPELSLLRLPAWLFLGLDSDADAPPFFPSKTGTVRFFPLSILGMCYSFVDCLQNFHALENVSCILVGPSFKNPSLYVGLFLALFWDGVKDNFVQFFMGHFIGND